MIIKKGEKKGMSKTSMLKKFITDLQEIDNKHGMEIENIGIDCYEVIRIILKNGDFIIIEELGNGYVYINKKKVLEEKKKEREIERKKEVSQAYRYWEKAGYNISRKDIEKW